MEGHQGGKPPVLSNGQNREDKYCRVGPRSQGAFSSPSMLLVTWFRPRSFILLFMQFRPFPNLPCPCMALVIQQSPLEEKQGGWRKASDTSHPSPGIATPFSTKHSRQWGSDPHQIISGAKLQVCWPHGDSFGQTRDRIQASVLFQLQAQKSSKSWGGNTMAESRPAAMTNDPLHEHRPISRDHNTRRIHLELWWIFYWKPPLKSP